MGNRLKSIFSLVLALTLTACFDSSNSVVDSGYSVRFIAIGDTGTGKQDQYTVADAVERVCLNRGCDFALGLGDNIYETGVTSVDDAQFDEKFEEPYKALNFPFYMALGNHDNDKPSLIAGLGLTNSSGEYQVAYTTRANKASNKWQMPARYYTFNEPQNVSNPLVSFFALDSNPLASFFSDSNEKYSQLQYLASHQSWLDSKINASTADWKIAFAHHPYVSNGSHLNAGSYDGIPFYGLNYKYLIDNSVCGKVDVLITGHDHDLQALAPKANCNTHFIISGAGAKTRSLRDEMLNEAYFQQGDTLGFFYIEISQQANGTSHFTMTAYGVDAESGASQILFTKTLSK